jgi:hypothetical protein
MLERAVGELTRWRPDSSPLESWTQRATEFIVGVPFVTFGTPSR